MAFANALLRRLTLRQRLIGVMMVLFALTVLANYAISSKLEKVALLEVQRHVETLSKAIEISVQQLPSRGKSSVEILRDYHSRLRESGVESITILNNDREVLASTLLPDEQAEKDGAVGIPRLSSADELYSYELTIPVVADDELLGYVNLHLVLDNFRILFQNMLYLKMIMSLIVFGIGILIILPVISYLTRPIGSMATAAQDIAAGNLQVTLPAFASPDLNPLVSSFGKMISALQYQRELEDRMLENERSAAMGQMAAGIAHDIRNPINFVALALDHLCNRCELPDDSRSRQLLDDAHQELMRASAMIQDFLEFGKSRTHELSPQDASEVLKESLNEVIRRHPDDRSRLNAQNLETPHLVLSVPSLLQRAFVNLLENGLEASAPDGTVEAGIERETDGRVLIWVQDSGPGIPAGDLEHIFRPYFSTKSSGIGLGLALTQKWIHEMKGEITAHNTARGARFEIRFPIVDSESAPTRVQ